MGFFDIFRRRAPIAGSRGLADFIDDNAAFLMQKGLYEYSRARAGPFAKVMMTEEPFLVAIEESRWRAYPLGLTMVSEMVEGVLRPHVAASRQAALEALSALVLGVFDRYPVPEALGAAVWADERRELARQLALIGIHPVKLVKDIPEPFAEKYFNYMPIHGRLRAPDFPAIRNYLKVQLCNIHDELTRRMDAPALAGEMLRPSALQPNI